MDEQMLARMLATVRDRGPHEAEAPAAFPAGCLGYERARELTLNPARWTAGERTHVETCRRCTRFLVSFERHTPHLPLWSLLRRRLGWLAGAEERLVAYHLDDGACVACGERYRRLDAAVPRVARFPDPLRLADPLAAGAAGEPLDVTVRSTDGALEAQLVEDGDEVALETRTREAELDGQLVGYALLGETPDVRETGFLTLQPDVEGWYTGHCAFAPAPLYQRFGGKLREALVTPVEVEMLGTEEGEALAAIVAATRGTPAAAGWNRWLEAAERNEGARSAAGRALLRQIRESLQ